MKVYLWKRQEVGKLYKEEKEETKGSRRQRKSRKIQEKNGPRIVQHRAETMEWDQKNLPDIGLDKRNGLGVADLEDGEMMEVDVPEFITDDTKTDSSEFDNTKVTQPIKMEMTNGVMNNNNNTPC